MDDIIEEARARAAGVLRRCLTPVGFKASALPQGYPHIWARDAAIVSLGASVSGDPDLVNAARASLETLTAHQSALGLIPLNVDVETNTVSTENAGAVDSNLWYILNEYTLYQVTHDAAFLRRHWPAVEQALLWLRYQDMNECGLLEVPEAGDWMDLMAVRYNTLSDNVLWYAVLRAYSALATALGHDAAPTQALAQGVHERLNLLMWIERCWIPAHFAERLEKLKAMRLEWYMLYHNVGTISSRPYYLPYVAFREYGDYCDMLGNLLAVLCGVADTTRSDSILRYFYQIGAAQPYPTKAIHPAILPGHPDWREYYRSRNLNLPHQYHNGGIWPMIGGFHIAALVSMGWHEDAKCLLRDLAAACQLGINEPWEFNEWLHGETGHPMGYAFQAWSASMYIYAYEAVRANRVPMFAELSATAKRDA
jgi:glycogen debranching enzyme